MAEKMKAYVLFWVIDGYETVLVTSSLESAKARAEKRDGALVWEEHNAHGLSWTATVTLRGGTRKLWVIREVDSEIPAVPSWQSLETAPRDGQEVLLRTKDDAPHYVVGCGMPGGFTVDRWMDGSGLACYLADEHFAGWMPIPKEN